MTDKVEVSWLDDNRIVVLRIRHTDRATVDEWVSKIRQVSYSWNPKRPFLALYDMSSRDVSFTPYMRQESQRVNEELASKIPNAVGQVAIMIPPTSSAHLLRLFFYREVNPHFKQVEHQVFKEEGSALAWLRRSIAS
jgi:hypothetical protein